MNVYVDELREHDTKLKWKIWCHMTADSDEELHEMADKIGHKREWFQPHPKGNHYDLTPSRRALAVKYGAIEEHSRDRVRRIRALFASENEANKNPQNADSID
jgi:hypothetical protein